MAKAIVAPIATLSAWPEPRRRTLDLRRSAGEPAASHDRAGWRTATLGAPWA
jgi:hypothetical protein